MKKTILLLIGFCGIQFLSSISLKLDHYLYPLRNIREDARKINTLQLVKNKLYIGYGDYGINTGPTDIISMDVRTGRLDHEFTVDDEAIMRFCLVDSLLMVPGADAMEDWTLGNFYVQEKTGWKKYRNIPKGLHIFDITSFKGKWFLSSGSAINFDEQNQPAMGCVYSSADQGKSWRLCYMTPADDYSVYRVDELIPFKGKLYTFVHSFFQTVKKDLPLNIQSEIAGDSLRVLNIMRSDPLGKSELAVYDGTYWSFQDIIPDENLAFIKPMILGDNLLLECYMGEVVYNLSGNGKYLSKKYYLFDGEKVKQTDIPIDHILDYRFISEKLYLLGLKNGKPLMLVSSDLLSYTSYDLPEKINPLSMEILYNQILIGCADGNIYKTSLGKTIQSIQGYPDSYVLQAEKPSSASLYHLLVSKREDALKDCQISFGKREKTIDIMTDNVKAFYLILSNDIRKPVMTFNVNGQIITQTVSPETQSLLFNVGKKTDALSLQEGNKKVLYKPAVLFNLDKALSPADTLLLQMYLLALDQDNQADLSLSFKENYQRGLAPGAVSIDDIYNICYRNHQVMIKIKGKEIKKLFSEQNPLKDEMAILLKNQNKISSFNPELFKDETQYEVMISNYLESRLKEAKEIDFLSVKSGESIVKLIIRYLQNNPDFIKNQSGK